MANNRMWLRCEPCGEEVLFAKYYPALTSGWYQKHPEAVEEFLEKHSYCGDADAMWGNTKFSLRFEQP